MPEIAVDAAVHPRGIRATHVHRPAPPAGAVVRTRVLAALDAGADRPMTLVCAPAGYGKSVAISQWAERFDRPVAWISLDSYLDDPRWFLAHLVGAVQLVEPDSMKISAHMASAGELPAENAVITELANGFDELRDRVVVVLDDYHEIASPQIHRIMSELLRHPPPSVHFVVMTRREPPLPIATLRARGQLTELRMNELAFDVDEVRELLADRRAASTPDDQVDELLARTEGWPAGLRLATEASRLSGDAPVAGPGMFDRSAQDYIVSEVLDLLPPPVRRGLVAISLFDRFDAELCDIALSVSASGPVAMDGVEFISWLERHNMFLVSLDDERVWFRFHHLFADLLGRSRPAQLTELGVSEIEVRRAAARAFESRDMADEAIEQFLAAGDHRAAAALAATHGARLVEEERWAELDRQLTRLPADVVDNDPSLLMLRAWLLGDVRSRHAEMTATLDRAETLLDGRRDSGDNLLRGQIADLRGAYEKLISADFDGAVADSAAARQLLATSPGRPLVFAFVLGVLGHAGAGRPEEAHRLANSVVGDARFADSPFDPMSWTMPYLGWLEGDLTLEERHAAQLLRIGERFGLQDTVATAHYFLGTTAYERNQLEEADFHLQRVIDNRYATMSVNAFHAGVALSLVRLAQRRSEDADAVAEETVRYVLDTHSDYLKPLADAFIAELDLRQGREPAAVRWARGAADDVPRHRFMFFDPAPTRAEILLRSTPDAPTAGVVLAEALDFAQRCHHVPNTIRLLGVSALRFDALGEPDDARSALTSAVTLAHEGGMVRRLADLGPRLAPLLQRLDVSGGPLQHVGTVLNAITTPSPDHGGTDVVVDDAPSAPGLLSLTRRELDVLGLLSTRFTNKEIAAELIIAPATVKKHTVSLYEKLNVHDRREAVIKARALGYVPDPSRGTTPREVAPSNHPSGAVDLG